MFPRSPLFALLCLMFLGSLSLQKTPCYAAPLPPLLFHASFDNTTAAVGPNGAIKPTSTEGKVEYRAGRIGEALMAGGDGALLQFPITNNLRPAQGTVEMWVQPVDWPADEQAFHVFFETAGPGWLVLYKFYTGGVLSLSGVDKAHYGSAFEEGFRMENGRWYHLVMTWHRNRLALYIDGTLQRETPLPSLPDKLEGNFMLGDAPWGTPHTSHTLLDEVKIYRYALPADRVAKLAKGEPIEYSPGLPVEVEPHAASRRWNIKVDADAYISDNENARATVEILKTGSQNPSIQSQITRFRDGIGNSTIDIAKLAPGSYNVHTKVFDGTGKELANRSIAFNKPPDAPWQNNKIGLQDRVLPPFTPITVGGEKVGQTAGKSTAISVECWNRKYIFDGPFPGQIMSGQQPMLAAPISLALSTAGGSETFRQPSGKILKWSPTRAAAQGAASSTHFSLKTQSFIEYDGMMWTDVTLTPKSSQTIHGLTLRIPLHSQRAKYLHHAAANWSTDNAGELPESGYETPTFQPFIWLGNEDCGLAWFSETQQGWSNAGGKVLQRVVRRGSTTELEISFVNRPTQLKGPLKISFGLQATPVKPQPPTARGWRLAGSGEAADLAAPINTMGNIQVVWPNGNMAHYGYPWPNDVKRFRQIVTDLHARKVKVVPYVNLNFFSTDAPEWAYYHPDFADPARRFSSGDVGAMGGPTIGACPHSPAWRDLIAYKISKFVDEFNIDGIYVDCWFPYGCTVESHGCGWHDADGNLMPHYPIRDYREIMRRVREILADRKPDFHIIAHMSASVTIPILSFADSMLDGEQYQGALTPKDDYLNVVPLDKWRSEHIGSPWGVKTFFLPEFANEYRASALPTQRLMGIMLAHDISPWPIWCNTQVVLDTWKTIDRFDIANAEFLPYWKPNGISTDNKDMVVSAYRKPGKTLLVVFNTGKQDIIGTLAIDPNSFHLKNNFAAQDLVSQTAIDVADRKLQVAVAVRNYRLVVIE